MTKTIRNIKCSNCGVFTQDADYCTNCGGLISFIKKREIKKEKQKSERIAKARYELENPNWVIRLKNHPFFLYKIFGWILYSAFLLISAIGALLAWFVAMVAAG